MAEFYKSTTFRSADSCRHTGPNPAAKLFALFFYLHLCPCLALFCAGQKQHKAIPADFGQSDRILIDF